MNAWGVPNWRDASDYGNVKKWSMHRWRWEFYRRREDLREYFDRWVFESFREDRDPNIVGNVMMTNGSKMPDDPGFVVGASFSAMKQFGYIGVPNPRIGSQPEALLKPIEDYDENYLGIGAKPERDSPQSIQYRIQAEMVGASLTGSEPMVINSMILRDFPLMPAENEAAFIFNLNEPLESQIKKARSLLRKHQKERHGRLVQRRRHPGKWLDYLRALDAAEEGAHWSQIAPLLKSTNQDPQSARDVWKQARKLQHNF